MMDLATLGVQEMFPGAAPEGQAYLRATVFQPPRPPRTQVASAADLEIDIHQMADLMRRQSGPNADIEIFLWPGDLSDATAEATRRARTRIPRLQRDKDAIHDWLIASFILVKAGGSVVAPSQAPLTAASIAEVFEVARQHPAYQDHLVILGGRDGPVVMIDKGVVLVLSEKEFRVRGGDYVKRAFEGIPQEEPPPPPTEGPSS
jgi:hypothetical protein